MFCGSSIVNVCTGGVKNQLSSRLATTAAATAGQNPPTTATATTHDQVDEQVIGQAQRRLGRHQDGGQQRQDGHQRQPGQLPPAVQAAGRTELAPPGPPEPEAGLDGPRRRPPTSTTPSVTDETSLRITAPAAVAIRPARLSTSAALAPFSPRHLQLRVWRPGEACHGQPCGAHHEQGRARLGHQPRGRDHDRGEHQHPAAGDRAVRGRGDGTDQQQRGAAAWQGDVRRQPAPPGGAPAFGLRVAASQQPGFGQERIGFPGIGVPADRFPSGRCHQGRRHAEQSSHCPVHPGLRPMPLILTPS